MADRKSDFDKWLMRGKDVIVIAAALTPVLLFGVRLYQIPDLVTDAQSAIAQHAIDIKANKEEIAVQRQRIDKLDSAIVYLSELVREKRERERVSNAR